MVNQTSQIINPQLEQIAMAESSQSLIIVAIANQ